MSQYTFRIIRYKLVTGRNGIIGKKKVRELQNLTVRARNYIEATLKAQKIYPSDKYAHLLVDTDAEQWPPNVTVF